MITYATDGNSLIDGAGNLITVFDSRYSDTYAILSAQNKAVAENKTVAEHYTYLVGAAQSNISGGFPYDALPDKPRQKVISDTGAVSYVAFVPPLPDLVIPTKVTTPNMTGLISAVVPAPVDKLSQIHAMVSALFHDKFPNS